MTELRQFTSGDKEYELQGEEVTYYEIGPLYLQWLAETVDKAAKEIIIEPGKCPLVSVRIDAQALRDAADEIERLRDLIDNICELLDDSWIEAVRGIREQLAKP